MKKSFILYILIASLFLISCDKTEDDTSGIINPEKVFSEGIFLDPGQIGPIYPGYIIEMNNGWHVYFYPEYWNDPDITQLVWGDLIYEGGYETGPSGQLYIYCPDEGDNCGKVWWRPIHTSGPADIFLGYYIPN
jgi:hypothetical protein